MRVWRSSCPRIGRSYITNSPLPNTFDAVTIKDGIAADNRKVLFQSLGDQQSIKGIPMHMSQINNASGMCQSDGQQNEGIERKLMRPEFFKRCWN